MTNLVRKGNPYRESDLVVNLQSLIQAKPSFFKKRSLNGADVGFCSRKAALHIAVKPEYSEDIGLASQLYFSIGDAVHEVVYKSLKQLNILIANELPLFVGPIHGFIDDIVVSEDSGQLKIIDVKTCGSLPSKIKSGQEEQLLLYALLTGIKEASILYVSRTVAGWDGKVKLKEIAAEVNDKKLADIAYVVAESSIFYQTKTVPPKPSYRTSESTCGFCPFKNSGCWSNTMPLELDPEYTYLEEVTEEIADQILTLADTIMHNRPKYYKSLIEHLKTSPRTNRPVFNAWLEKNS